MCWGSKHTHFDATGSTVEEAPARQSLCARVDQLPRIRWAPCGWTPHPQGARAGSTAWSRRMRRTTRSRRGRRVAGRRRERRVIENDRLGAILKLQGTRDRRFCIQVTAREVEPKVAAIGPSFTVQVDSMDPGEVLDAVRHIIQRLQPTKNGPSTCVRVPTHVDRDANIRYRYVHREALLGRLPVFCLRHKRIKPSRLKTASSEHHRRRRTIIDRHVTR